METIAGQPHTTSFNSIDYIRSFVGTILIFVLLALVTVVVIIGVFLSFGKLTNWFINNLGPVFGRTALRILGVKLEYDKMEFTPDIPAVYISNHSSTLDLFIIISAGFPNVRYVAKKELQYNPFFFILGKLTGQVFIDRSNREKALSRIHKTYDSIRQKNLSLFIAPEGSRKHELPVGKFKKGAFFIARDLDYPIVPVLIKGAIDICPGGSLLTKPGKVTLKYFKPFPIESKDDKDLDLQIEKVRRFYIDKLTN